MKAFVKHFYNFYKQYLLQILLFIILNFISIGLLLYVNRYLNGYLKGSSIDIHILIKYSIFILVYYLIIYLINYIDIKYLCFKPLSSMFNKSYRTILTKDYSKFITDNSDNYIYNIFEVPQMLLTTFPSFIYIISSSFQIIFVSFLLIKLSAIPFIVIVALLILFEIINKSFYGKINNNWDNLSKKTDSLQSSIVSIFSSIWYIKIYNLKNYCSEKLKKDNEDYATLFSKNKFNESLIFLMIDYKNYILEVIYILLYFQANIAKKVDIIELIFQVFLISVFIANFSKIISSIVDMSKTKRTLIGFHDLLNNKIIQNEEQNKVKFFNDLNEEEQVISLNDCKFHYKLKNGEEKEIFDNLNLNIFKGDKIAITGENGSGKTTLIKILADIYQVDSGQINYCAKLFDQDICSKTKLKENFIYSNPYIFNISLKENLCFDRDFEENILYDMLDRVDLKKFYSSFPIGIDSIIQKNSMTISDGEKLRIALLRGLLRKDDIEIIFLDEFTKNIDSITEEKIFKILFDFFKDKVIIAVSHRLSTILKFDKILFIDSKEKKILFNQRDEIIKTEEFKRLFEV